ncbi:MAG: threonine/serine exporter family protein [Lachnospiraceae bacterium]|nr:threonine/serine exporter family protein [Lachnospiraceae bacterium]MDD3616608.1 threonine/serine exporter family protein [Lachnospiraceae bacterium]
MWIQLIAGTVGAIGFGLVFGLRMKYIPVAALGGFICWAVYLAGVNFVAEGIFWPTVLSAAVTTLFSELCARVLHIPATAIYTPAVVPLIPGSTLFYTMNAIVQNDWMEARRMAVVTIQYALGIAIGMSLVYALFTMIKRSRKIIDVKQSNM